METISIGKKIIIRTDQRNLKYLWEQCIATLEQHEWIAKLMRFEYEIQYQSGKENMAANALSRLPNSATLNHLFVLQVSIWEQIKHAAANDDYVKRITSLTHTQDTSPYAICQGLVFFKGRVVVPLKLRETLIFEAHDTKMGGHSRVLYTFKRLATQFY